MSGGVRQLEEQPEFLDVPLLDRRRILCATKTLRRVCDGGAKREASCCRARSTANCPPSGTHGNDAMPELPDVSIYVEQLVARIVGQPLVRLDIAKPFVLRSFDPPVSEIVGTHVRGVRRLGKPS